VIDTNGSPGQVQASLPVPFQYKLDTPTGVLNLTFPDTASLTKGLGRCHIFYEGGEALKGPLKGINFPIETLEQWMDLVEGEWAKAVEANATEKNDAAPVRKSETNVEPNDRKRAYTDAEVSVLKMVYGDSLRLHGRSCGCADTHSNEASNGTPTVAQSLELLQIQDSVSVATFKTKRPPTKVTYILGSLANDKLTHIHEWAHAKFHLSKEYQLLCGQEFQNLDKDIQIAVAKELKLWNYRDDVIVDEFQAYMVEGPLHVFGKRWSERLRGVQGRLKEACGKSPFL
jgi:hypothetical protein